MRVVFTALCTALTIVLAASAAIADIREGRDLMEAGDFVSARKALLPAAQVGNADAEELIGVMYAMGLGVERNDERAFEWYFRARGPSP